MHDKAPQVVQDDDPNDTHSDFLPIWFVYGALAILILSGLGGVFLAKAMYG